MKPRNLMITAALVGMLLPAIMTARQSKEFLTPLEITRIQDAQEIDQRVKVYLEAAALRLKTAADRLSGRESIPGDPLEFFSVEDLMDGYYRILSAVMLNLEAAAQNPKTEPAKFQAAMKNLKSVTEAGAKQLEALKKTAEDQQKEEVWKSVVRAIEINKGAHDGAASAARKNPEFV